MKQNSTNSTNLCINLLNFVVTEVYAFLLKSNAGDIHPIQYWAKIWVPVLYNTSIIWSKGLSRKKLVLFQDQFGPLPKALVLIMHSFYPFFGHKMTMMAFFFTLPWEGGLVLGTPKCQKLFFQVFPRATCGGANKPLQHILCRSREVLILILPHKFCINIMMVLVMMTVTMMIIMVLACPGFEARGLQGATKGEGESVKNILFVIFIIVVDLMVTMTPMIIMLI